MRMRERMKARERSSHFGEENPKIDRIHEWDLWRVKIWNKKFGASTSELGGRWCNCVVVLFSLRLCVDKLKLPRLFLVPCLDQLLAQKTRSLAPPRHHLGLSTPSKNVAEKRERKAHSIYLPIPMRMKGTTTQRGTFSGDGEVNIHIYRRWRKNE